MSSYKDIGPSQYNIYKNGKVIHVINDVCEEDYDFSGTYEIEINTYGEKGVLADILSGLNGEDFYIERVSYKKSNDSDEVIKKTEIYKCNKFRYVFHSNSIHADYRFIFYNCEKVTQWILWIEMAKILNINGKNQ